VNERMRDAAIHAIGQRARLRDYIEATIATITGPNYSVDDEGAIARDARVDALRDVLAFLDTDDGGTK